jgi:hypothetical protein
MCCLPVEMCSGYMPPPGYVLKDKADSIACKNSTCSYQDLEACTDEEGMCSSYSLCPQGESLRSDAAEIECQLKSCSTNASYTRCCAELRTCPTLQCPEHWVPRPLSNEIRCDGWECHVKHDLETCCRHVAYCDTFDLGGYSDKFSLRKDHHLGGKDAADIPCESIPCSLEDLETCTVQNGFCSSYKCPVSYVHRADADTIH